MFEIGDLVEHTENTFLTKVYPPGIVIQASTDVAEVVVWHFNGEKIIWMQSVLRRL